MKPNTNRWLGNRGQRVVVENNPRPDWLIKKAQELGSILGDDEYYKWSSTLSNEILMNPDKYAQAIEQKFAEVNAEKQAKKQPKITRVDVKQFPGKDSLTIKKFGFGWNCQSQPVKIYETTEKSFDEMEQWFIDNGWIVYKWEACPLLGIARGLRAFLPDDDGKINSVRTKYQMKKYRGELEKKIREYMQKPESFKGPLPDIMGRIHVIDLAKEL